MSVHHEGTILKGSNHLGTQSMMELFVIQENNAQNTRYYSVVIIIGIHCTHSISRNLIFWVDQVDI